MPGYLPIGDIANQNPQDMRAGRIANQNPQNLRAERIANQNPQNVSGDRGRSEAVAARRELVERASPGLPRPEAGLEGDPDRPVRVDLRA